MTGPFQSAPPVQLTQAYTTFGYVGGPDIRGGSIALGEIEKFLRDHRQVDLDNRCIGRFERLPGIGVEPICPGAPSGKKNGVELVVGRGFGRNAVRPGFQTLVEGVGYDSNPHAARSL